MSVTVKTSRENTNPKRRRGTRQFDCGKEDAPSLTRRVSMTDHLDFGGDRREVSRFSITKKEVESQPGNTASAAIPSTRHGPG